jgi:peptidoglycan-associated lipoprotein
MVHKEAPMLTRRWQNFVVPVLLICGMTFVGCAKRPATTQASAPAPTGAAAAGAGLTGAGTTATGLQSGGGPAGQAGAAGSQGAGSGAAGAGGPGGAAGATQVQPGPGAGATPPRVSPREFAENPALQDIHFDFDKSDIRADAAKTLDANASWMKTNANNLILIEGHCDERGTNEYNLALGERRARSTMNYLVAQGVQASRITIISYGEERPGCTEKTEACWQKNRRAHFLVKAQ